MNSRRYRFIALIAGAAIIAAFVFAWRVRSSARLAPEPTVGGVVATTPTEAPRQQAPEIAAATTAPNAPDLAEAFAPTGSMDDPAALDAALQLDDRSMRGPVFGGLLRRWLARDFNAALAYVRRMSPGNEATNALLLVLEFARERDPLHALALARDLATAPELAAIYSAIFAQLAERDLSLAIENMAQVPAGRPRENALRALLDRWSRTDLPQALAWAQNLSDPAERSVGLDTTLAILAHDDPLRAAQLALESLTGDALARVLAPALAQLTATDVRDAAALVSRLPEGELQVHSALGVARVLASRDPAGAIAWVGTLPAGDSQRIALNNALDVWAAQDPSAATRYIAQMPDGPPQDAAAENLARLLGERAPAAAIALAESLGSASARAAASIALASAWARTDPAAATRWAAGQPASSAQLEALSGALSYWTLLDIGAARDFVSTLGGSAQVRAAMDLAPVLAQQNPASAVAWAQSLTDVEARNAALVTAAARWAGNAPEAAAVWALGLPPGLSRDNLIATIAIRYADRNPSRAQELAGAIDSPDRRSATKTVLDAKIFPSGG